MTLTRLFAAVLALCAITAFTDIEKKFSIDFPNGWSTKVAGSDGTVQADSPAGRTSSYCRANSITLASLKDVSQETLNTSYAQPLDKQTWAGVLSVDPAKFEMSEASAKIVDGHVVQFTTLVIDASLMGGVPTKARFSSHILTGRMVNAGCFAPTAAYDGVKATFEKVVTSLKPR